MKKILSLILLLTSMPAMAIELQTKPKNSDKSRYNVSSGVKVKPGLTISSEFNYTTNPLVVKGTVTKEVTPLISSLLGLDLGLSYGFKDLQLGVVVPLESSTPGSMGLGSSLIEGKYRLLNNLAIGTFYQLSSNKKVKVTDDGVDYEIPVGSPSGAYGVRILGEIGDIDKSWGMAGYVGYKVSPDNKYLTLDQSNAVQFGVSGGLPLTKSTSFILEFFGEKTPSNMPMEAQALLNVKEKTYNYYVGAGSGNLQGSGSNGVKAFLGLSWSFGSSKSSSSLNKVWERFDDRKKENSNFSEDDQDESSGPQVLDPEDAPKPILEE